MARQFGYRRGLATGLACLLAAASLAAPVHAQEPDYAAMGAAQREMQARLDRGDNAGAIESGLRFVELIGRDLGNTAPEYAFQSAQLARIAAIEGDAALAERLFNQTLAANWQALPLELAYETGAEAARFKLLMSDPEAAITVIDQTLALLYASGEEQAEARAALLGNRAIAVQMTGRLDEASNAFARLFEAMIAIHGRNGPETLRTQHNLAATLGRQGRAEEALAALLDVYERRAATLGEEHPDTLSSLNDLANSFAADGNVDEAERILRRVLAARQRVLGEANMATIDSLENLADLLHLTGRSAEALEMYAEVAGARRGLLGPIHRSTQKAEGTRAQILWAMGESDAAEQIFASQLDLLDSNGLGQTNNANVLAFHLGRLRHQRGDPRAGALLERAYRHFRSHADEGYSALRVVGAEYAQTLLADPARAHAALDPADFALTDILIRREALFAAGFGLDELAREADEARLVGRTFADALWTQSGGEIEAEARNRLLAALQLELETPASAATKQAVLRVAAERGGGDLPDRIMEREIIEARRSAVQESLRELLAEGSAQTPQRQALNNERLALLRDVAALDASLRADFPDYFDILSPALADLDDVRDILQPHEAVVVLVPAAHGTHVVAITSEGSHWHRSALGSEAIEARVRRLLYFAGGNVEASLGEQDSWLDAVDGGFDGFDRDTAYELYRELFGPLEAMLAGKDEWLLAPGGSLASMPFAMLVTEPPQGRDDSPADLRATRWLIDRAAIAQLPSLQTLLYTRRNSGTAQASAEGMLVGFGNPVLTGNPATVGSRGTMRSAPSVGVAALPDGSRLADPASLRAMASLPGTEQELTALAAAMGDGRAQLYLAENATEAAIKQADLRTARTLVLATHGLVADEIRGLAEPGLVFTPPTAASALDDGYLTASEVLELQLGSEWVILSACNTAAPEGEGATALSGLARAFFFAGAQSLVVSHWPVRDDVAPAITVGLVTGSHAAAGRSAAQALRQAIVAVRDDPALDSEYVDGYSQTFAHPSAWAPFILVGGQ